MGVRLLLAPAGIVVASCDRRESVASVARCRALAACIIPRAAGVTPMR